MIALIPVFVLWFGLGFAVKAAMVMVLTVFAIAINTWNGVQNVPRTLIEVGTAFCASQPRILRQIVLPSVIPAIMTGLRIGIGKAVVGIVIAEFFTAIGGLGGIIVDAGHSFQPDRMFAAVVVLMARRGRPYRTHRCGRVAAGAVEPVDHRKARVSAPLPSGQGAAPGRRRSLRRDRRGAGRTHA